MSRSLHVQVWSYNYDPEPTGVAPTITTLVDALRDRGHHMEVVAAHPHYPEPVWGRRLRPYREVRNGIPVLRLPLWIGRATAAERARQELSFLLAQSFAAPSLATPDAVIAVSPSFPALLPAMVNARVRRIPWVLWLKDILPDGAEATGQLANQRLLDAMSRFERVAYRAATHIVVIADSFVANLTAKGVPANKITRIHDPATHRVETEPRVHQRDDEPIVLCMGNIGHTQGLDEIVRAFEGERTAAEAGVRLVIAGSGMAEPDVRRVVRTSRVEMTGLLFTERLERELQRATLGAVTQRYGGTDFNVPSKLMNYMACGLPVVASVRFNSEAARLVERAGCGWVTDSRDPGAFARKVAEVVQDPEELTRRSAAGLEFARRELTPAVQAARAEEVLFRIVAQDVSRPVAHPPENVQLDAET